MVAPRIQSRKGLCSRSLFQKRRWKQCYPFCCVIFFWVILGEVRRNYNEMNELLLDSSGIQRFDHDLKVEESDSKEHKQVNDEESRDTTSSSAFCLLIKDDNEILSEWIAYHYHLFRMQRLIVAVDPTSETSPKEILENWKNDFGLDYTLWNDEDYATDYFVNRDYSKIPVRDGIKVMLGNNTKSSNAKSVADFLNNPVLLSSYVVRNSGEKDDIQIDETYVKTHQNEIRQDLLQASLHLFRQKNFVSECYRTIKSEQNKELNYSWVVHTDTDEYLVPHPWIALQLHNNTSLEYQGRGKLKKNPFQQQDLQDMFPEEPTEDSLWTFFEDFVASEGYKTATLNLQERAGCVVMPRIDFGSNEDDSGTHTTATTTNSKQTTTFSWNHSKFESLRWKFHGDFTTTKLAPKTIIDVHHLSEDDDIWRTKLIGSVHRPSNRGCIPPEKNFKSRYQYMQPLAVYHYLGSLERYLSRTDVRRNAKKHQEKNIPSNYAEGDENVPVEEYRTKERAARWWMKGWFDSFVATHGATKVYKVLGKEYASKKSTTI